MKLGEMADYGSLTFARDAAMIMFRMTQVPLSDGTIRSAFDDVQWHYTDYNASEERGQLPRVTFARSKDEIIVTVNGTGSLREVIAEINPGNLFHFDHANNLCHKLFDYWGERLADWIGGMGFPDPKQVILAGHSYGGAICIAAAIYLQRYFPSGSIRVVTFGSPKVGSADFYSELRDSRVLRWVNYHDPIPGLPPSLSDFPGVPILTKLKYVTALNFYKQFGDVVYLRDPGETSGSDEWTKTLATKAWLAFYDNAFGENPTVDGHAIGEYLYQLNLVELKRVKTAMELSSMGVPLPPPPPPPPPPPIPTPVPAAGVPVLSVFDTFSPVTLPKRYLPFKQRIDDKYAVVWMGRIIAFWKDRKRCATMVRYMRAFLRNNQTSLLLYEGNFVASLADYMVKASVFGEGFIPTLPIG